MFGLVDAHLVVQARLTLDVQEAAIAPELSIASGMSELESCRLTPEVTDLLDGRTLNRKSGLRHFPRHDKFRLPAHTDSELLR